jgi:hypothetical protein
VISHETVIYKKSFPVQGRLLKRRVCFQSGQNLSKGLKLCKEVCIRRSNRKGQGIEDIELDSTATKMIDAWALGPVWFCSI